MDQAIDRCCGGHWILEDLLPLGERQVAAEQDARSLVAIGDQGEEQD